MGTVFKTPKLGDPRLEEFPLGSLSRVSSEKKSLAFHAQVSTGKDVLNYGLTITPGKGLRIPAFGDVNILLATVHLTKEAGMKERVQAISRYQLAMLLGDRSDQTYDRINKALEIWQKTTFLFVTEYGEPGDLTAINKTFNVVSKVEEAGTDGGVFKLTWTEAFWSGFAQGAWQTVDLREAIKLRPVTQRLHCFVQSRFRGSPKLILPLSQLVIHLGLAEGTPVFRNLQQVRSACRELEELKWLPVDEGRFVKGDKEWGISFSRAEPPVPVGAGVLEQSGSLG